MTRAQNVCLLSACVVLDNLAHKIPSHRFRGMRFSSRKSNSIQINDIVYNINKHIRMKVIPVQ